MGWNTSKGQRNSKEVPGPVETFPYVKITQLERNDWRVQFIWGRGSWDQASWHRSSQHSAERKGRRELEKWKRKYGNLKDPYNIR